VLRLSSRQSRPSGELSFLVNLRQFRLVN